MTHAGREGMKNFTGKEEGTQVAASRVLLRTLPVICYQGSHHIAFRPPETFYDQPIPVQMASGEPCRCRGHASELADELQSPAAVRA
jgi:hypothetical protein